MPRPGEDNAQLCWVSPSDLNGTTGNILSRLVNLETRVARLKTANIQVGKASDVVEGTGPLRDFDLLTGPGTPNDGHYTGTVVTSGDATYNIDKAGQNVPTDQRFAVAVMEDGTVIWGWRSLGTIAGLSLLGATAVFASDVITGKGFLKWTTMKSADFAENKYDSILLSRNSYYLITARLSVARDNTDLSYGEYSFGVLRSGDLFDSMEVHYCHPAGFPAGTYLHYGQTRIFLLPAGSLIGSELEEGIFFGGEPTARAYMTVTQWAG